MNNGIGERKILNGVSLDIERHQVIGILGRNGCGKSCFLKIMTGQLQPQFKYISHNDIQVHHLYKKKGLINYLPQHECHPASLRLRQLLDFYGIDDKYFLEKYALFKEYANKRFSNFSGGERRLLEVLLVLEADTKYSILDEPFTHIMPLHIDMVKATIQDKKQQKGIIITDHQYHNVLDISDHTFLLKNGTMKAIESEEDLREWGYIL